MSQNLGKHFNSLKSNRNWILIVHRTSSITAKCKSKYFFSWQCEPCTVSLWQQLQSEKNSECPLREESAPAVWRLSSVNDEYEEEIGVMLRFFSLPLYAIPLMLGLSVIVNKAEDLSEARLWILNGWIYPFRQSEAIEGFKISWWHNENVFREKLMNGGQKWRKGDTS